MRPKVFIPIRDDETFACLDGIRDRAGVPLWKAFLGSLGDFDIFVDTDSLEIKEALDGDPTCRCTVYLRDDGLRGDGTTTNDLIASFLDRYWIQHESIIQIHLTHPFMTANTLLEAWQSLGIDDPHDSVMSVDLQAKRLWSSDPRGYFPINHNPMNLRRTSQLPPIYAENSAFYVFTAERFRAVKNRLGLNPRFFEITAPENIAVTSRNNWRDLQTAAGCLSRWITIDASKAPRVDATGTSIR